MAAIESVGTMLEEGVAGYAEQISGALITSISPVIFTGVSLYFLLKGWMFLTGRAEGAIADTVIAKDYPEGEAAEACKALGASLA